MEEKYANKEILTAGIALAILVFSANVVMPAVGAALLYKAGKLAAESAMVYIAAGTAAITFGWGMSDQAEKIATYTGIAAGVLGVAGFLLMLTGVGVA
ncbi:MAG: hypothetical protein QXN75_05960 [Thermoproteota archaeon]